MNEEKRFLAKTIDYIKLSCKVFYEMYIFDYLYKTTIKEKASKLIIFISVMIGYYIGLFLMGLA